jgi:hypothetical protein
MLAENYLSIGLAYEVSASTTCLALPAAGCASRLNRCTHENGVGAPIVFATAALTYDGAESLAGGRDDAFSEKLSLLPVRVIVVVASACGHAE